jgi:hypothetical protein
VPFWATPLLVFHFLEALARQLGALSASALCDLVGGPPGAMSSSADADDAHRASASAAAATATAAAARERQRAEALAAALAAAEGAIRAAADAAARLAADADAEASAGEEAQRAACAAQHSLEAPPPPLQAAVHVQLPPQPLAAKRRGAARVPLGERTINAVSAAVAA